jgi:hypothetical protein
MNIALIILAVVIGLVLLGVEKRIKLLAAGTARCSHA